MIAIDVLRIPDPCMRLFDKWTKVASLQAALGAHWMETGELSTTLLHKYQPADTGLIATCLEVLTWIKTRKEAMAAATNNTIGIGTKIDCIVAERELNLYIGFHKKLNREKHRTRFKAALSKMAAITRENIVAGYKLVPPNMANSLAVRILPPQEFLHNLAAIMPGSTHEPHNDYHDYPGQQTCTLMKYHEMYDDTIVLPSTIRIYTQLQQNLTSLVMQMISQLWGQKYVKTTLADQFTALCTRVHGHNQASTLWFTTKRTQLGEATTHSPSGAPSPEAGHPVPTNELAQTACEVSVKTLQTMGVLHGTLVDRTAAFKRTFCDSGSLQSSVALMTIFSHKSIVVPEMDVLFHTFTGYVSEIIELVCALINNTHIIVEYDNAHTSGR
jgi:hypothetical protein